MKKLVKLALITLVFALSLTLSACGGSFDYDKDAAVKSAQELIETANTKDYKAIVELLPENLKSLLTAEQLRDAWDPLLSSAGAFVEYEKAKTTGVTQNGVNYVIVVVPCKYDNATRTFTITYTTDLTLAALEMK
ncbi:MAG TPA: DUF3887 domain-containing protein [Clostridia bacterium]|nr:DUF3887 domain-containing protein [Clostridia bacterium]